MEIISSKNKNLTKPYTVFFDLDRTIIRSNSGKTLIWYALKKGLMSKVNLVKGISLSILFKLNLRNHIKIIGTITNWLKGVPESTINELSAEIFRNNLFDSINPEIETEITSHRKNNAGCVILSASILPICQTIADYLMFDDIICSNLEVDNGIFTGRPSGKFCFGEEKVVRLLEYCKLNSIDLESSWYYGDSISDLPVLSIVGNPICVNPDRKLKRVADKRGWQIIN
jgi:HAD superfamily hydrolase (TIGR01490 family)